MLDLITTQTLLLDATFSCIAVVHLIAGKCYVEYILAHQTFEFHTQTCTVSHKLFAYLLTHLLDTGHLGTFHYMLLSKHESFEEPSHYF